MTGTKRNYISLTAFILCLLAFYTSQAQTKPEATIKHVRKQSYIETSNHAIVDKAIKELGIKRYSESKEGNLSVYRLSFKQNDSLVVFNWLSGLYRIKTGLK